MMTKANWSNKWSIKVDFLNSYSLEARPLSKNPKFMVTSNKSHFNFACGDNAKFITDRTKSSNIEIISFGGESGMFNIVLGYFTNNILIPMHNGKINKYSMADYGVEGNGQIAPGGESLAGIRDIENLDYLLVSGVVDAIYLVRISDLQVLDTLA